jgi:pimeloyl-ACP methyl ester carboxylesterase
MAGEPHTIVLIHGMWMTPLSWEHWAERFRQQGHEVIAPAWPGLDREPAELRADPSPLHGLSITDVVDNYEQIIRGLDRPPIIIGHSFGGLFTQLLADRGLGAAAAALDTAAPKGVLKLPLSTLRAAFPALKNPFGKNHDVPLTYEQFNWCFTNALSETDSKAVYERYYIPGAALPFFQAAYANFNPGAATKVNYKNAQRPPLLLVTGAVDRICPPSVNEATFEKQRQAPSATEHREYPGRCHWPGQDGWEEVADFVLGWTVEHSRQPSEALA